jgi:UDPglucose 6-dehydrogenase
MRIHVYGAGYVGLVSAVCLAKMQHDVVCLDIDKHKIARLARGEPCIYERGLESLLRTVLEQKKLVFSDDLPRYTAMPALHLIALGTPPDARGAASLDNLIQLVEQIAQRCPKTHLPENNFEDNFEDNFIVIKSTVPPGTLALLKQRIKKINTQIHLAHNPEFLQEGQAINQFFHPDRVIIGCENLKAIQLLCDLYAPLITDRKQLLIMSPSSSELSKYAANTFLATKISFMNEIAELAEHVGADIHSIKEAMGLDKRINPYFLNAGCGFGGSCFPKDLSALIHCFEQVQLSPYLLKAVKTRNHVAQLSLFEKTTQYFSGNLRGKRIALWGLSFKPDTDDIRDATSHLLVEAFSNAGAKIRAYDPMGMDNFAKAYPNHPQLQLCTSALAALQDADALVIATEWPEFSEIKPDEVIRQLKNPVVFDGRGIWPSLSVKQAAWDYYRIGAKPSRNLGLKQPATPLMEYAH